MPSHKAAMVEAARIAGAILREQFGKHIGSSLKSNMSLVTELDVDVEKRIIASLRSRFPYRVLAEESGEQNASSQYEWVIDPLDGTSNFVRGIPLFCVSIALVRERVIEAGIVYQPYTEELFAAERGKGAQRNGERIRGGKPSLKTYVFHDIAQYSEGHEEASRRAARVFDATVRSERSIGTAALALAYVAAGKADAFVGFGQKAWDVAAGVVLCREAGLTVTNWDGEPWRLEGESTLAAPKGLHNELVRELG
jgi:myo-inositol-1(or 4)-monophosphatase